MPISETRYTARFPLPDIVVRGRTVSLTCPIYSGTTLTSPTVSGSSISIYDSNGTAKVSAAAITVSSSTATYSLTSATTTSWDLDGGYYVEWSLVIGTDPARTFRNKLAVVLRDLYPVLLDTDLTTGRYMDLDAYLTPAGLTSWENYRLAAWDEILRTLLRDSRFPWLVTEPSAFLDVHRDLTLALIFAAMGMTQRAAGGERDWLALSQDHRRAFERGWSSLVFDYDSGESGRPDGRKTARPVTVLCAMGDPRP